MRNGERFVWQQIWRCRRKTAFHIANWISSPFQSHLILLFSISFRNRDECIPTGNKFPHLMLSAITWRCYKSATKAIIIFLWAERGAVASNELKRFLCFVHETSEDAFSNGILLQTATALAAHEFVLVCLCSFVSISFVAKALREEWERKQVSFFLLVYKNKNNNNISAFNSFVHKRHKRLRTWITVRWQKTLSGSNYHVNIFSYCWNSNRSRSRTIPFAIVKEHSGHSRA